MNLLLPLVLGEFREIQLDLAPLGGMVEFLCDPLQACVVLVLDDGSVPHVEPVLGLALRRLVVLPLEASRLTPDLVHL